MANCLNEFITCPACPTAWALPDLPSDYNCQDLPIQSEIQYLFLVPVDASGVPLTGANPFTSWSTTPTVTSGAVDNTDPLKAHIIKIVGNIDAPEKQTALQPGFKTVTFKRVYTLNAQLTSLGNATYEALLQMQCGRVDGYKIFFADGTHVYGDAVGNGICLKDIDVDFVHASGEESFVTATIVARWSAKGDPIRKTNPYA